jgi:hypothetical protein
LLPRLTREIRPITIRPIAQLHLADRRNTTKITIARIPTLSSPSNLTLVGQSTFTTFNVYHIFRIMAIYPISQSHNVIFRTLAQIPISRSIASSCPFNIAFFPTCACYQYSRNTFSSVSVDVQPRLRPGENKVPRPCLKRHSLPPSHFNTPFRRHVRTPVHISSTGKYASSGLLKLCPYNPERNRTMRISRFGLHYPAPSRLHTPSQLLLYMLQILLMPLIYTSFRRTTEYDYHSLSRAHYLVS